MSKEIKNHKNNNLSNNALCFLWKFSIPLYFPPNTEDENIDIKQDIQTSGDQSQDSDTCCTIL